jgi:hypothetical protein
MGRRSRRAAAVALLTALGLSACAAKRIDLPSGTGTPSPDAAAAYELAVKECRGVRTLQATLGLSGRAGTTTLRGNVDAGFEAPEMVRLEGRHPLGRPVFILVAANEDSTLYMPRDNRVLRNVPPAWIVEALVGLPLTPGELRSMVSGCGFGVAEAAQGREYSGGYVAVETAGATTYLRQQEGRWRVVAASRPPLTIQYAGFVSGRATIVRVVASGSPKADLTVRLSDVNINVTLDKAVFAVDVPAGAEPLTLDELRRAGPLGGE